MQAMLMYRITIYKKNIEVHQCNYYVIMFTQEVNVIRKKTNQLWLPMKKYIENLNRKTMKSGIQKLRSYL